MSELQQPSLFHTLRHTPMRDVLRGHLTKRLDVKQHIRSADLPEPAKALVDRVVRRTWLPKLEQIDVANELIAHFSDGLQSGVTVEELIQSFGDERAAAKLIRRAKQRGRPLVLKVSRGIGWMILCIFLLYVALCGYFFTGHPTIRTDYLAMLNADALKTSLQDRAWPSYRGALTAIGRGAPEEYRAMKDLDALLDAVPGQKRWPELVAWLRTQSHTLDLLDQGAAKPALGLLIGTSSAEYEAEFRRDPVVAIDDAGKSLSSFVDRRLGWVSSEYRTDLERLSKILAADARLAREKQDPRRVVNRLSVMVAIANQLRGRTATLVDQTPISILQRMLDEMEQSLAQSPSLLSDADLQQLAHRLSEPDTADELIDTTGLRLYFYDWIQRSYTDDGAGGGRLTDEGLKFYNWMPALLTTVGAAKPFALFLAAPRQEIVNEFENYMAAAEAALRQPARDVNWRELNQQIDAWMRSPHDSLRYQSMLRFVTGMDYFHQQAERYLARREAVLVGLALELHRREHGSYPDTLAPLAPTYLPALPVDRITGEPLKYRVIDGTPLIYSVGADRDDDGGRVPTDTIYLDKPAPLRAARWAIPAENAPDGDWVLYPQPRAKVEESANEE